MSQIRTPYLTDYDELTALPNRRRFVRQLHDFMQEHDETGDTLALMLLKNIDRFKSINDNFEHVAGDEFAILRIMQRIRGLGPSLLGCYLPPFRLSHERNIDTFSHVKMVKRG
ncbi:GGDEF domain-containing protein [Paenibacillus albus]|uniref:Diguanylate cyclase n=1 Tax=Paenibacillus albus TaxID=2495582 RepID=A0A3S9A1A6_9BACL|nr:diguanylate cyclase [Paenibacillus albus]AZN39567.1 diguanylate cyclase [Paenibacillus albus]